MNFRPNSSSTTCSPPSGAVGGGSVIARRGIGGGTGIAAGRADALAEPLEVETFDDEDGDDDPAQPETTKLTTRRSSAAYTSACLAIGGPHPTASPPTRRGGIVRSAHGG